MAGLMYCRNPMADNGTRVVAAPNDRSGTTVATPALASSSAWRSG